VVYQELLKVLEKHFADTKNPTVIYLLNNDAYLVLLPVAVILAGEYSKWLQELGFPAPPSETGHGDGGTSWSPQI